MSKNKQDLSWRVYIDAALSTQHWWTQTSCTAWPASHSVWVPARLTLFRQSQRVNAEEICASHSIRHTCPHVLRKLHLRSERYRRQRASHGTVVVPWKDVEYFWKGSFCSHWRLIKARTHEKRERQKLSETTLFFLFAAWPTLQTFP